MSTPEDRVEQDTPAVREPAAEVEVPLEAVAADVVEQAVDAGPAQPTVVPEVPLEADAADAADQAAVVELDEDEEERR